MTGYGFSSAHVRRCARACNVRGQAGSRRQRSLSACRRATWVLRDARASSSTNARICMGVCAFVVRGVCMYGTCYLVAQAWKKPLRGTVFLSSCASATSSTDLHDGDRAPDRRGEGGRRGDGELRRCAQVLRRNRYRRGRGARRGNFDISCLHRQGACCFCGDCVAAHGRQSGV